MLMRSRLCDRICVKETLSQIQNLRERDTVTDIEFDEKGKTNEEELLQAESEHDGTAEQEEQTPASAENKLKNEIKL